MFEMFYRMRGRISRKTYIVSLLCVMMSWGVLEIIFRLVKPLLIVDAPPMVPWISFSSLAVVLVAGFVFWWPLVALVVKRLHDMGRSGWYFTGWIAALIFLNEAALKFGGPFDGPILARVLLGILFLASLAVILLTPGESRGNKYGDVPGDGWFDLGKK
jgi:uncharacterized membrane protein YhaH (DUF805 family)